MLLSWNRRTEVLLCTKHFLKLRIKQHCGILRNVGNRNSPDFPSARGPEDNDYIFLFGWTYPPKRGQTEAHRCAEIKKIKK